MLVAVSWLWLEAVVSPAAVSAAELDTLVSTAAVSLLEAVVSVAVVEAGLLVSFSISLIMVVVAVELLVSVFDFSSFWPVRFIIVMLAMMIDKILATVAIVFWKAQRPVLICCLVGFLDDFVLFLLLRE